MLTIDGFQDSRFGLAHYIAPEIIQESNKRALSANVDETLTRQ
jgi:hypothetical protein